MEALFGLVIIVALIAMIYFIVRAVICKVKKNGGAGSAVKKAGISAVVFIIAVAFLAQVTPSQPKPAEQQATQTAQQAPAKEEKAAEPTEPEKAKEAKEAKQIDTPVIYDVAADKQSLTDYVNSTVGARYKITNLHVSEYSDGVYQIMFGCRDSKYGDAESAKAAGKEIRELMPDFPCKVNLVAVTFEGGLVSYDPSNPKMQIVSEGKKSEF